MGKTFILLSFLFLLLFSCDKHAAKKLSGTYSCKVSYHYWDMTPTIIDSVYTEDIKIEQQGKSLVVLGTSIHIDSLRNEQEYKVGSIHDYLIVKFKNERVYITKSSGGLGGNAAWTYEGSKK